MKLIAFFYIKTIKMHVLKLVNIMKRSTRMPLLNDGPWISCGLRLGPMTSLPGTHAKACCTRHPMPQRETRRNVEHKEENLTETLY